MKASLEDIRNKIPTVLAGLENTLYEAARKVISLKRTRSTKYADAILDQNSFGGDTAQIYFYRFAPRGSPRPSSPEFPALITDPNRARTYKEACYRKWAKGIRAVQRVIQQYGGVIEVNNIPLDQYLATMKSYCRVPEWKVCVRISVPGQDKLRKLREIVRE